MKHMIGIKMDLVLSLISLTLISMLVPSYAYGQVAALQPMPTPIQTQSQMVYTQCIDFNMDKVCEYIVLANGTTIANPLVQQIQAPAPMSQLVERQKTIIKEVQGGNDDDYNDREEKTYCDVPNPSNPCHDRRDVDEYTGLATCLDGSHEEDWRDCEGGGADNDNDNDSSRNEGDDLPNCNDVEAGTHCDGSEDEDSWVDEPAAEEEGGGTWEDDGYIDENGDGYYDEGEE